MESALSETEERSLAYKRHPSQPFLNPELMQTTPNSPLDSSGLSLLAKVIRGFEKTWVRMLTLIIFGVGARYPGLQGQLIWDDLYLARDNPFMKSPLLMIESFRHFLFPDSFSSHYRPVQHISYSFDYLFWNTNPYGFHLSNVCWHVGSGILLYFLLRQLLGSFASDKQRTYSGAAFLVALLWVVHPVHSAAVDYISGRADSLAFAFAAGSWLLYLRARRTSHRVVSPLLFALAGLSALLALCSRETGSIWLLIFLIYLFAFDKTTALRTKLLILVACLSIAGAYLALRQLPSTRPTAAASTASPAPVRATLMLRALGDYGRLMVLPLNLHMDRTVEAPEASLGNPGWRHAIGSEYLSILGLIVATCLGFGSLRKGAGRPIRAFGTIWFVVAFLPISNLIALNATVAEHWLYLPSVGLLLFGIGCYLDCPFRFQKFALTAASLAVVALTARSFVRSADWMSPETFYRHSLASGASKVRIALNLGQILTEKGDYAKAEPLLRKVLEMSPDYPIARNALAHLYFLQGKKKEAEELFAAASKSAEHTRKDYPRTWVAALNVAHMCYGEHDIPGAIATLERARHDYPGTWALISFESELLRQTKGPDAALTLVQKFAHDNWWHFGAHLALAKLYAEKGDAIQAEATYRHASWLDVHDAESLNLIALMRVRQNRLDDAYETQRRAVARQPDEPRQYLLLSDILDKMGRATEAHEALAQVTRLQLMASAQPVAN